MNPWTPELQSQLLEGARSLEIELSDEAVARFETYLRELLDWNRKVNLTAIREPAEIVSRHFLDSLTCLKGYDFSAGRTVIDVGTGAGFPGLPLKIAFPQITLTLLDSSVKKIDFLKHLCHELGLSDVDLAHGRSEDLGHTGLYRQRFHLALARGLAPLPVLLELCLPFVSVGGYLLAQKNLEIDSELEDADGPASTLGGGEVETIEVVTPGTELHRSIVRVRKEASTPSAYPRRPGVPNKHPLGSPSSRAALAIARRRSGERKR